MPQRRKSRTPGCKRQDQTKTIGRTSTTMAAKQEDGPVATKATDQRNQHRVGNRTVGKRRISLVKDGLRDRPERKPIMAANYYAALN